MKKFALFLVLFISITAVSQNVTASFEKYPVFKECANTQIDSLAYCFNFTIKQFVFENFKIPEIVENENYKGNAEVFFEISKEED